MSRKSKLLSIACALALGLGATTAAQAAAPQIRLLDRPADNFDSSIENHKIVKRYEALGAKAKRLAVRAPKIASQPDYGLAGGVSQATLESIAACESGGDPTAVDSSGTYSGKYQFDYGTWASVGGIRQPGRRPGGRAGLPSRAALQPRRFQPLADLRIVTRSPGSSLGLRVSPSTADG